MKQVRTALWPVVERSIASVSEEMRAILFGELAVIGKHQAVAMLDMWRPIAFELAGMRTERERKKFVEKVSADRPWWAYYALAAWMTRTLAHIEYLERSDLAIIPKKWAAEQVFLLMANMHGDDTWLWPFPSESPWAEEDTNYEDE